MFIRNQLPSIEAQTDCLQLFRFCMPNRIMILSSCVQIRDGSWPNSTRAYLCFAVNKRPTHLWPGYFLTRPDKIFLTPREKLKYLYFYRGNFPNLEVSDPTHATKKWSRLGQKYLAREIKSVEGACIKINVVVVPSRI